MSSAGRLLTPIRSKCFKQMGVALLIFLSLGSAACPDRSKPSRAPGKGSPSAPVYSYEVVHVWPHDVHAFTQGLIFYDGKLLESTGQVGRSSLRRVELETGNVLEKVEVPPPHFAEGITLFNGRIYQLTWQDQLGFIYDSGTFEKLAEFNYQGEGWGLTNDGKSLILSDGTNRLRFLDPTNFQVTKTIAVFDGQTPVMDLNELEYVQGEIYANVWHDDRIARIDPQTGRVTSWINLSEILTRAEVRDEEAVLNGIAYDDIGRRLFVTGKLWPKLFEIRIKQ
jgi:glutaminyl-peptide cyclotransferase